MQTTCVQNGNFSHDCHKLLAPIPLASQLIGTTLEQNTKKSYATQCMRHSTHQFCDEASRSAFDGHTMSASYRAPQLELAIYEWYEAVGRLVGCSAGYNNNNNNYNCFRTLLLFSPPLKLPSIISFWIVCSSVCCTSHGFSNMRRRWRLEAQINALVQWTQTRRKRIQSLDRFGL